MKEWLKEQWGPIAAGVGMMGVGLAIMSVVPSRPVATPRVATVAPEVRRVETEVITPKSIVVYKAPAKKKLAAAGAIPKSLEVDTNVAVVAASRVPARERATTVTTTLNTVTGATETYVADAPRPWVALENRGSVSLDYGLKLDYRNLAPKQVVRLTVREDLVQLKALHLGLVVSGDSDGTAFAGVGLSYRW